jgi:alkylhydroperoxidase family enzyme
MDVVQAALNNWQTAPIDEKLRTTLGFLEKLTLTPEAVTPADLAPLYQAGVTEKGIEEAIYVCFLFNLIDRLADTFDFEIGSKNSFQRLGWAVYNFGYDM